MKKSAFLWNFRWHLYQKTAAINHSSSKSDAGYTLIELLIVVIILAVLAAIAAPSWLGFISQRRVNAANEVVFRALQEAQSLAKSKKQSYSVSFRENDGVPEIAVYQTKKSDGTYLNPDTELTPAGWKNLRKELGIKPGQVRLRTNLQTENNGPTPQFSDKKIITFDYMGILPNNSITDPPLTIVVGVPTGNSTAVIESKMRCVKITTLLGALSTDKGSYNATTKKGCPL